MFNQWQTSVIQTSDRYIFDFSNHLGQSNPPIYHKRLLNMQSDVPPSNQKPVKKTWLCFLWEITEQKICCYFCFHCDIKLNTKAIENINHYKYAVLA